MGAATRRRWLWVVFTLIFLAEQTLLWWLYWGHGAKPLFGDEALYHERALGVAGLASVPPKVWLWPPLQHWFIAVVLRVSGGSLLAIQLIQHAMLLGCAVLLRVLWRHCDGRVRAANLATALFLLNPSTQAYAFYLWPEILHLLLLLGALWLLVAVPWRRLAAAAAGAAVGVALLAKSLLAGFWPAFVLLFWREQRRAAVVPALLFVLGLGVVTAPMLGYGWRETGAPLIADSAGFNLLGGLTDRWRSDYIADSVAPLYGDYLALPGTPQQRNAVMLARAEAVVETRGLGTTLSDQLGRQYFRLFSAKTPLLSQLPGPACAGYVGIYRGVSETLANTTIILADVWHALTLAGAAFGLAFWRRWRDPLIWWMALFVGYQVALFLGLHVKARFLLPLLPFFAGFAASAIVDLRAGIAATLPRWRWMLAAAMALGLLVLAFGGPLLDHSCG